MSVQGELSLEQIARLVQVVFAGARVVTATPFPGEHANLNYDLRLTNPTMEIVLKVYRRVDERRTPWKETYLLRLLTSETGVPVPRVLYFDDSNGTLDCPWSLHTRLPGNSLAEVSDEMSEDELESIGYEMGRYLGRIHQIPLDEFGDFFAPDPLRNASEKGYFIARAAVCLERCAQNDLLNRWVVERLEKIFSQTTLLTRHRACLIHGGYREDNIIVEWGATGYHVTGVLDFERAQGGSPEQDMSALFLWSFAAVPAFQKGFLDGYAESGRLDANFWERLHLYQALTCLESLAAARRVEECQTWIVTYAERWGE